MPFNNDIFFDLAPEHPKVFDSLSLMKALHGVGFDPQRSVHSLEQHIAEHRIDPSFFDLESVASGGAIASHHLLFGAFGKPARWRWRAQNSDGNLFEQSVFSDEVPGIADLFRQSNGKNDSDNLKRRITQTFGNQLSATLWPDGVRQEQRGRYGMWPPVKGPGIYRREHASLILRSGTTTIITDPQGYKPGWTTAGGRFPDESHLEKVDGILLTHSHGDHWHIPSILKYAKDSTVPVIVPEVPRPSLLCPENMAESLRTAGQRTESPSWWSLVQIGDFIIDILPFYGEQPLRSGHLSDPDLRNWGNCYRLTCPEFSAVILADSGFDAEGDMIAVIERSVEERGPIDAVLSCCFDFPEGFNPGLPHYFLTVPLSRLQEMAEDPRKRLSMTLGASGVARVCEAARCKYFLPYAHGFQGVGSPSRSAEGGKQIEEDALEKIRAELGLSYVEVVSWMPGDVAYMAA